MYFAPGRMVLACRARPLRSLWAEASTVQGRWTSEELMSVLVAALPVFGPSIP